MRTIGNNLLVAGTTLVTSITLSDGQATCAAYNNGTWQYLIGKTDRTASGDYVSSEYAFDANNRGDLAFEYVGNNYNVEIAARVNNTFHYIQSMSDFLPDGALLLGITQILMNDDGAMYSSWNQRSESAGLMSTESGAGRWRHSNSIAERGGVHDRDATNREAHRRVCNGSTRKQRHHSRGVGYLPDSGRKWRAGHGSHGAGNSAGAMG